ncbi:hypothetical protein HY404_00200 [Candidatus Microgenomates bacterium]|nr:hypothetical protein [Candidatus Microgenomates bacterium]
MNSESRIDLGLTIFEPQTAVELYRGETDERQKLAILNEQIVRTNEGGVVLPDSLRDLMVISTARIELAQYRPDAISGLDHPNLVGVAIGLVLPQEVDPLLEAIEKIRTAAGNKSGELSLAEMKASFAQNIFEELEERLVDHQMDPYERAQLINAIDGLFLAEVFGQIIKRHPEILPGLIESVHEFHNEELQFAIERYKDQLENSPVEKIYPEEE